MTGSDLNRKNRNNFEKSCQDYFYLKTALSIEAWIVSAFSFASCPLPCAWNSCMSPPLSPFCASAICRTSRTLPTKFVPIVCILAATRLPILLLLASPFLTGRLFSSSAIIESDELQAHRLPPSLGLELDPYIFAATTVVVSPTLYTQHYHPRIALTKQSKIQQAQGLT